MTRDEALQERVEWIDFARGCSLVPMRATEPAAAGTLERLGPWRRCPGAPHCWLRAVEGGDPTRLADRRVFVEKTPRVFDPSLGLAIEDCYAWVQGDKGEADDGEGLYGPSRRWADDFARAVGYVLPEDDPGDVADELPPEWYWLTHDSDECATLHTAARWYEAPLSEQVVVEGVDRAGAVRLAREADRRRGL